MVFGLGRSHAYAFERRLRAVMQFEFDSICGGRRRGAIVVAGRGADVLEWRSIQFGHCFSGTGSRCVDSRTRMRGEVRRYDGGILGGGRWSNGNGLCATFRKL